MARKFVAVSTDVFLRGVEAHLADHQEAGKAVHQKRQVELREAGVLVKRKSATMTANKK
jgi:hypothetical protein